MTIQSRMFDRIAVCSSRLAANNYFSVTQKDIDSTNLEAGDNVRVMLIKPSPDSREIDPMDRDIYDSTLQKSNQVYVPKDTREKLDLETGDTIKYIVIPKKSFPGLEDGPVRNKAKEVVRGDGESETETKDRPERQTSNAEFSGPMQKTGQITIPADVMDNMGLLQGDTVLTTVEWQGNDKTLSLDIGTGNRITLPKDTREELGLEPGDEPEVRIAVFD